jgi:hypothetical protein
MMKERHSFLYKNGLSLVLVLFMLIFLAAQFVTGWTTKNEEMQKDGFPPLSAGQYVRSGHFIQATFENWESEFLQMALYVLLTIALRQKGSAESKKLDEAEEVDREPKVRPNAPWAVRRGGFWLLLYKNSLSLAFTLLFLVSFILHFYGSLKDENEENLAKHALLVSWKEYICDARFWFESFQNWQSEFLAVASIVLLSIWLRQHGSPESKPVDAPNSQTGE